MRVKKENLEHDFRLKLKTTNTLPQYMKDIYLKKLLSKKFSEYWIKRVTQIIKQLDIYIK